MAKLALVVAAMTACGSMAFTIAPAAIATRPAAAVWRDTRVAAPPQASLLVRTATAVVARKMLVAVGLPVVFTAWAQATTALFRRSHRSELVIEAAKITCAVEHDEDVCEVVYGKEHNFLDKIFDERLREAMNMRRDW